MTQLLYDNKFKLDQCPQCQAKTGQNFWPIDRIKKGKKVLWCSACGIGCQYPMPGKTEIQKCFKNSVNMIQSDHEKKKGFKRRIQRLNYFLPNRGNLLDVGCGFGHFLLSAQKAGWCVEGVEPNEKAAKYCRNNHGLNVMGDIMENRKISPESFDVVTLWDVWEHVFNPVSFLDQCLEMLTPGGILAIAIPNASGWPARLFKGNWRYVMLTHLNYFTMDFVNHIMDKRQMKRLKADHTIKIQSLLQGVVSLLPINYNAVKVIGLGRRGGLETEGFEQPLSLPKKDTLRTDFLYKLRQLVLSINLMRFSVPVGDMVDLYFRKGH